jgi:hypothetical protein
VKRYLGFAAASIALIGAMLGVMMVVVQQDETRRAVMISAVIALMVQFVGFAIARALAKENVVAGWGLGVLLRFGAVIAFGFVAPAVGLPLGAALMSLVAFLLVSTLIEPLFLKP